MILSELKKQLSKKQVHSIQSLAKELNLPKKEIINALELLKIFDGLNNVKIEGEFLTITPPCIDNPLKFNCQACSTSFCLLKAQATNKSHQLSDATRTLKKVFLTGTVLRNPKKQKIA